LEKSPVATLVVLSANFRPMIFKRIVPDKYYYLWRVWPCSRVIADDITNINFGFKQFVTAVGIYAATNPLW